MRSPRNFSLKASLSASLVVSSILVNTINVSAATFNFELDSTFDATLTPPYVGSGTLSFDGAATVGTFSLASLSNLNMNFSFTDGSSFNTVALNTNLSNAGISVFDQGSGNLGAVFTGNGGLSSGGSVDFTNSFGTLTFEPTSSISNSTGCCGGNGVTNLYRFNSFQGSYNTVSSQAVPEPFTIVGTLVGGTAAFRLRKKLKAASK